MIFDPCYVRTPEGSVYSILRIGGAKATEHGFLLFGNGADEILEYLPTPLAVALAWRDATDELLTGYRPGRAVRQIDWLGLAAVADQAWAVENGWVPPKASPAATGPRRMVGPERSEDPDA